MEVSYFTYSIMTLDSYFDFNFMLSDVCHKNHLTIKLMTIILVLNSFEKKI